MNALHDWRIVAPVYRVLARFPRLGLAAKAAAAAAAAWAAVFQIPGSNDYPYYAPLGAVIAVSTTVAGSIRESVQGVVAILIGAAVALAVDVTFGPNLVTIALVVAIGTLLAGWERLGSMASWVPISSLFVLIIGNSDPLDYVLAYGGFTTIGAAIGIGLNLAFPPLPLTPAEATMSRLRDTLASQLCELADGLRQQQPRTGDEWEERRWTIEPISAQMRTMIQKAAEARRGNRRAKRYRNMADLLYQQARALQRMTFLVEDLTVLIAENERRDRERFALGQSLREPAARVIEATADVLRSVQGATAERDELRTADAALNDMVHAVRDARQASEEDMFAAGSIVVSLRRCLSAVVPSDLETTIPSG
ncbi:MAG TPA: aromatic acid exporter family protein [Nocardioidaceae bacterium]|nr:aromatic acid exporter family protein [Nocardioidaceae bacterium]